MGDLLRNSCTSLVHAAHCSPLLQQIPANAPSIQSAALLSPGHSNLALGVQQPRSLPQESKDSPIALVDPISLAESILLRTGLHFSFPTLCFKHRWRWELIIFPQPHSSHSSDPGAFKDVLYRSSTYLYANNRRRWLVQLLNLES